jgi:hypothetical protein
METVNENFIRDVDISFGATFDASTFLDGTPPIGWINIPLWETVYHDYFITASDLPPVFVPDLKLVLGSL